MCKSLRMVSGIVCMCMYYDQYALTLIIAITVVGGNL